MRKVLKSPFVALGLVSLFVGCGPKKETPITKTELVHIDNFKEDTSTAKTEAPKQVDVEKKLQTELRKLNQHPVITVILMPKEDNPKSIKKLKERGGKLIYDPNNGHGSSIPFYIAELTLELINDTKFLKSLNLKAASYDESMTYDIGVTSQIESGNLSLTNFIPTDAVDISSLGEKETLGEGITVAVIDTGIDASHPVFGGRVDYWFDATQETRTQFTNSKVINGAVKVDFNGKLRDIKVPMAKEGEDLLVAVMAEKNFNTQLDPKTRQEKGYLDINLNNSKDSFLIIGQKKEEDFEYYMDTNGDGEFSSKEELEAKISYNKTSTNNRNEGLISFPTRTNILAYPLLTEEIDGKYYVELGIPNGIHGTHVAGIVAGDSAKDNILGAAPKATLMSLKVCSGISCTSSAIVKGLYQAFYNGKVIPDVVNISLGSHEGVTRDLYSYVLNDLSAKFGTIFFISASNSGPGFRSLNRFGNSGPAVMVGANVSEKTLREQYNLSELETTQNQNLFYFSSLGPSYTGEMKPNIIAPGAAISAAPASGAYMYQANGTSMSSPLAAGTFASVLSVLKKEDPTLFSTINKVRKENQEAKKNRAETTLLPYVYAMRDALQEGAEAQPNLSMAQQGFGLIKAGKTKMTLEVFLKELQTETRDYFEVTINDYKSGYDRSGELKPIAAFALGLGYDGERSKESESILRAQGVEVELLKVEVLENQGTLKNIENKMDFFSIVDRGNEKNKLLRTHIAFNNKMTTIFYSKRNIDKMEAGKTYLAHYSVKSKGVAVNNILDVVHIPHRLGRVEVLAQGRM